MNRRAFITSSAAAVTVPATRLSGARVAGANDRIGAAFVGVGGMGRANLRDFMLMRDVRVIAVCDVWEHNRDQAVQLTEKQSGGKALGLSDFRRLLDLKEVELVVISTPEHWHAIPAILACEAGKDVYVEKPLAHNIYEGRKMVEAARRNNRVVQVGTQQRSGKHYQEAVKLIREGKIGKVTRVSTWNLGNSSPVGIGNPADSEPPPGLDWDMYLGPAPKVRFNPSRFISTFRMFWDYAGGMMTDWGTHHFDIIHWAMNVKAPLSISVGGAKFLPDNGETPDTFEAVFEYPGFVASYSHRALNGRAYEGKSYGIAFYGVDGTLLLDRNGYEILPETERRDSEPKPAYQRELESAGRSVDPWERPRRMEIGRTEYVRGEGSEQHVSHVRNFVDCVKSRSRPNSDVEIGHHSTAAVHLANIAYRTSRKIRWDAEKEQVIGDTQANQLVRREYRSPWKV